MWKYLQSLPPEFSVAVIILAIIAAVIISLKGRAFVKWGKSLIGLGNAKEEGTTTGETGVTKPPAPPTVTLKYPKRSCGDCLLIVMGEREKYEINMRKVSNRVLKQQMNFVEQKLVEMQTLFTTSFMDQISRMNGHSNEEQYEIQYKLFYGLLKDCLFALKDEFRRSLKENGFFDLDDTEFANYVKDKTRTIISTISQYFRNLYPTRGILVPVEKIAESLEKSTSDLQNDVFAIYVNAKQIEREIDFETKEIQRQFGDWVDAFVN